MCDKCGRVACTLTLVPPFGADPQAPRSGEPGWIPGTGPFLGGGIRLSIDGPLNATHTLMAGVDVGAIEAALRAADAVALYEVDSEYVPFWCIKCGKSYCKDCLDVRVEYEDGFYDRTRASCPEGHTRTIDD